MDLLLVIILSGAGLGYWANAMRAREFALRAARVACQRENVQLLDESVVLTRTRPARDGSGRLCLRRHYQFEFSDDGGSRRNGSLEMVGTRTVALRLELADFTLHT